jgi:hypothetical protein
MMNHAARCMPRGNALAFISGRVTTLSVPGPALKASCNLTIAGMFVLHNESKSPYIRAGAGWWHNVQRFHRTLPLH